MMRLKHLVIGIAALALASTIGVVAQQDNTPTKIPVNQAAAATKMAEDAHEGRRLFEQHCSRCHNAPEGFSPRIAGTVTRHMRVRASLSQHEEETLLRFFNP